MAALVARSYDQPTGANPMVGGLEHPGWMLAVTPSPKALVIGSWLASSSMQAGSASSPSRDETWWDPLGHHECIEQDSKANHPVNCLTIHFTHYFRLLTINHYWTCRIIWNPYLDHVGGSLIGYNWYIYTNLWLYYILWMLIISISYQIHHWWIQTELSAERLAGERQQLEAACGVLPGVVSPFLCRKAPETEKKQKGLLPGLKSPIVCIYIFIVSCRYITWSYVFCCPCASLFFY